jgi:flagellar basal body-associated protein FliL
MMRVYYVEPPVDSSEDTESSTEADSSDDDDSSNAGKVIGIVIGIVLVIAIGGGIFYFTGKSGEDQDSTGAHSGTGKHSKGDSSTDQHDITQTETLLKEKVLQEKESIPAKKMPADEDIEMEI